uniref:Multicopper oxidase LPR1-like n=1 Tax=Nelumbo nucifera TaxID=4432 RepID=A0A822XHY0_NELNU|nr:TPA_asm: hypothetical protein HUJ06_020756 [Nelumbo nucifera]
MRIMMSKLLLALIPLIATLCFKAVHAAQTPPSITEATLYQVAASLQMFVDELPELPKLYGYSMRYRSPLPGRLTIGMYQKKWKFHRDLPPTTVFAYGTSQQTATVPGPTIETLRGVPTYVTWQNYLPQSHILPWDPTVPTAIPKNGGVPTVVHLHGGESTSHRATAAPLPGSLPISKKPDRPGLNRPTLIPMSNTGNLWYHDHALGLTRANLLAGLIGAYVIRDPKLDASLNLSSGPEFDRHLFVFDRSFSTDGSLYMNFTGNNPSIHPQWQPEYFGDAIVVNGKAWPYLSVQRRKYRFRIINASNARYFRFSLSNGLPFVQVASDSSYLPSPVHTQNYTPGPFGDCGCDR